MPHAVHGLGRDLTEPDWPPLTDEEASTVLGPGAVVTWCSPRPMSAAALVRRGPVTVFVKRHHRRVRTPEQLAAEHALAAHLRERGQPVPAVLPLPDSASQLAGVPLPAGGTVLCRGDFCYEAHELAAGVDAYRDAVSWSPYASPGHAYAAGMALARLHLAAADFPLPARPPAVLMNSCQVIRAADPLAELTRLIRARPALAAYLDARGWSRDRAAVLAAPLHRAGQGLPRPGLPGQWGHGDWHPSNLTWTSAAPDAQVAGIIDLGLANRTFAAHDLALALERAVVSWLDLPETGTATADLPAAAAVLDGYQAVRPLSEAEITALPLVLPVVHVEYALSEVDYYTAVVPAPAHADLAYQYLVGHTRWFGEPEGEALLRFLAAHLARR